MRIVFMGTPQSAVPSLERCLQDGHEVMSVWTQPDKPAGRGHHLAISEVKQCALKHQLAIEQPARIRNDEAKKLFASYQADVAVVVAYGKILPPEFLHAPRRGCINVHFSLLPLYRGAAPVNWAILNGDDKTGVTTMFIAEELDSGPILMQTERTIGPNQTAPELMSELALDGANLLGATLRRLDDLVPRAQQDANATFAPLLKKEQGLINWSRTSQEIERQVRGLQPWPMAYTNLRGQRLIIWSATVFAIPDGPKFHPGTLIKAGGDDLIVACGGGSALRLLTLQPQSKRRMNVRDFLNGTHLKAGDSFGEI
jgi:methionyl-tRNA formyltransferase